MRQLEVLIAIAVAGCVVRDGGPATPPPPPQGNWHGAPVQLPPRPDSQPPPPRPDSPPGPTPSSLATAQHSCPRPPALDQVQGTLSGAYGGIGYGGNGRSRFVVTVSDYMTLAPLPGVPVVLSHDRGPCNRNSGCRPLHPHPPELLALRDTTDAQGRVVFDVPDLDYQFRIDDHGRADYLGYSSTYRLGRNQCHPIVMQAAKVDSGTRYFAAHLLPVSMLVVQTRDQAIAIAEAIPEIRTWRASHPAAILSVTGGSPSSPTAWQVRWGTRDRLKRSVVVNALDGSANVNGRWTD